MRLQRILVVPHEAIIDSEPEGRLAFFITGAKALKRKFVRMPSIYNSEIQRYGDIPRILGRENTFVLGRLYPHFYSSTAPESSPYPSCHGLPQGTSITERELESTVGRVDAVLISVKAGVRGERTIALARKKGIPIAILDAHDHQSMYEAADIRKELFWHFQPKKDFDLYFKENLPLGYKTDTVLPLAPAPVRPEMYQFDALQKNIDVFYSGRERATVQPEGGEVVDLVKREFLNTRILEHKDHRAFLTLREYWNALSCARIVLSPSRRDWDSFRHCETGLAHGTALVAPRPYVETVGPELKDGVNAILYDTHHRGGKYYLADGAGLVDKIRHYLDYPALRERIAARWREDVLGGHTTLARSRYIVDSIEQAL